MMKSRDLIALMPGQDALELPAGLSAVAAQDWRAVLAKTWRRTMPQHKSGRVALVKAARQRQLWLEALLPQGTVLPVLSGTRVRPSDLNALVIANAAQLAQIQSQLAGRVQYQITISGDLAKADPSRIAIFGYPGSCKSKGSRRGAFAAHATRLLQEIAGLQIQALPVRDDIILNVAVLLPETAVARLDRTLEQIDALWSEGLTIRQVGPSPGVSFASFGLKPVSDHALTAARQLLNVEVVADLAAIKAARHHALKDGRHPSHDVRQASEILTRANNLEAPRPYPFLFTWSEGQSLQSVKTEQMDVA